MACPVDLLVGIRRKEFAARTIEYVKEAVAVELHHDLARKAVNGQFRKDQLPHRIVVIGVVRRELVVPRDLAGFGPQGQHRGGVKVVARPVFRRKRGGIADAPIGQV